MTEPSFARTPRLAQLLRSTRAGWVSLAAALVATWPLATRITSSVTLGTEHEATVPLFDLWNLWWTADRIPHGFHGFLDAPFFYPNPGVTAYSEPMPLLGVLVSPLWAAGAGPALVYNVALLAVLTLNGVFSYRLARALTVPVGPSLLCCVAAVTLPFTANLAGVLPNLALFGMLWTLDGLIRFGRTGSGPWAGWAAAGFVATFLTFQQFALFFAPVAFAAGLVAWSERRFSAPAIARLGTAGLLGTLAVLVVALPSLRVHRDVGGFERPVPVVRALSAQPADFATRPATATVGFPSRDSSDTGGLFPGAVLIGLTVAGGVLGFRDRERRRWILLFSATAAFGFVLSLGLTLDVAGWSPYGTLRDLVPAFAEIRSPYRAAALVQLCLPVVAAVALQRVGARAARGAVALMLGLGLLASLENLSVPAPLVRLPETQRSAWASWVRDQPDRTVLAHIPFPDGMGVTDYEVETARMLAQTTHRKPIVNGYSSFFPVARDRGGRIFQAYTAFQLAMARDFPNKDLLCVLTRGLRVDTLVVDRLWLALHEQPIADLGRSLQPVFEDPGTQVYAVELRAEEC